MFRTLSQNSEMTELFPRTIVFFGIYIPSEAGVEGDPTHWLPASDSCLLCFDHSGTETSYLLSAWKTSTMLGRDVASSGSDLPLGRA